MQIPLLSRLIWILRGRPFGTRGVDMTAVLICNAVQLDMILYLSQPGPPNTRQSIFTEHYPSFWSLIDMCSSLGRLTDLDSRPGRRDRWDV